MEVVLVLEAPACLSCCDDFRSGTGNLRVCVPGTGWAFLLAGIGSAWVTVGCNACLAGHGD